MAKTIGLVFSAEKPVSVEAEKVEPKKNGSDLVSPVNKGKPKATKK